MARKTLGPKGGKGSHGSWKTKVWSYFPVTRKYVTSRGTKKQAISAAQTHAEKIVKKHPRAQMGIGKPVRMDTAKGKRMRAKGYFRKGGPR